MNENNSKKNRQESDIRDDTMKQSDDYDNIDFKFIEAIDQILEKNGDLGIKPNNDSSLGKLIYPSNRSIISSVRSRSKHIPHLALINFAKIFDVDMNYFYSERTLNYIPQVSNISNDSNNSVNVTGNSNVVAHAGNGHIGNVKTVIKDIVDNSTSTETIINNFIPRIDEECLPDFYKILNAIRNDNGNTIEELKYHLKKKSKKLDKINRVHQASIKCLSEKLLDSNNKLIASQEKEKETMMKYITLLESK